VLKSTAHRIDRHQKNRTKVRAQGKKKEKAQHQTSSFVEVINTQKAELAEGQKKSHTQKNKQITIDTDGVRRPRQ